ncbi:carbonic anhydrase [Jannaschia sp. LMIT008]|uniref:carbonic anhydrase n=1 Tax=Jannaschia maritima TaxID=3032585 RepID=UPI0028125C69|nr:carbonic anhydrase [Jannaschia sp. LMIT008]
MKHARPLPGSLVGRYHGWKATTYADNAQWYRRLATDGQRPRAMIVACCDSRVHLATLFEAEQGEFFIHRNIANIVPPYEPDGLRHGTSAALEYAVTALNVTQVIVMGHSHCGGIEGCHDMCAGHAPELESPGSFVGRWMDVLRPAYEVVKDIADPAERLEALGKQAILTSLENLMTFPFVADPVQRGDLALHAVWNDIAEGGLEVYDPRLERFAPV